MFIDKIELENYRPYYGCNPIYLGFNKEDTLNFNVITGNNADGKSSLLNAVTWAFYGKELHDVKKRKNPIYNKIARNECIEVNKPFTVRVKLELFDFDDDGNKIPFHVERSETYEKDQNSEKYTITKKLTVLDFDGEMYDDDEGQLKIDSNISNVMHKYFFFNGEQLEDYLDSGGLKDTVEMISQLNLISTVKNHLTHVRGLYTAEIGKNTKEVGPINEEIDTIESCLSELEEKKSTYENDIVELKKQIKRADEALEELKESKKLANRRKELLLENDGYDRELKSKKRDYNKKVMELYSIVSLFDVLYSVTSNGDFVISQQVLEKIYRRLLSEGKCFCGVDLNKNPKHRDHIKELLDEIDISGDNLDREEDINKSLRAISGQILTIEDKHDNINNLRGEIFQLNQDIRDNKSELNEISSKLKHDFKGDEFKISTIETTREDSIKKCKETKGKLKKANKKIIVKNKELDDKIAERDAIIAKEEHNETLKKELKFCESARNIVKDLDGDLKDDILDQINDKISDQFLDNSLSGGKFENVSIDKKFNVNMTDYLGEPVLPGDLSGGEERILALSFIVALNSISGFDLPLFIDAPLTGLDDKNTKIFLENLPKFTENKQIIFLFIGDVYNEDIEKLIRPYLNKKIKLNNIQTYITEVINHEQQDKM